MYTTQNEWSQSLSEHSAGKTIKWHQDHREDPEESNQAGVQPKKRTMYGSFEGIEALPLRNQPTQR